MVSILFLSRLIVLSLIPAVSFADKICSGEYGRWDGSRCVTTGVSATAAVTGGIYAAKKYSEANSIEKQHTKRIFDASNPEMAKDKTLVSRATGAIHEGERVTFTYELNEAENRAHHIGKMEAQAASSRTMATSYAIQATTATKTVWETVSAGTDAQGNQLTTQNSYQVPDYAARATYTALAVTENAEARKYELRASEARQGGAVPTYSFSKVIDGPPGTTRVSTEFAEGHLRGGGKVISIDRLAADKLLLVRNSVRFARAGVAGAAIGAGVLVEEVIAGKIANKIERRDEERFLPPERRSSWNPAR
jgi:hypothetical protein